MKKISLFLSLVCVVLFSCEEEQVSAPKPRAYHRITLPEKKYVPCNVPCPFVFDLPVYAQLNPYNQSKDKACWYNIELKGLNATIHLSYSTLNDDLAMYLENVRSLAYKHTSKAQFINEQLFENRTSKTYGMLYDIGGDAASNCQFYVTDSVNHFIRGALYFNSAPNADSLKPVNDFIREDIIRLVESLQWR